MKRRIGNILLGYTNDDKPFTVNDLGVAGAITVLLKDALLPNLVQTTENTAAFVHGGPFANIAHGCNSVLATKMALTYGDYVITEAGFGADLGAEKFFDIKCRKAGLTPKLTVIVATAQSLKLHGGVPENKIKEQNIEGMKNGFENLDKHVENMKRFGQGSDRDFQQVRIRYGRGNRTGRRTLPRDRCWFLYEQRICCRWRRRCRTRETGGRHDRKETFHPAKIHLRGRRIYP